MLQARFHSTYLLHPVIRVSLRRAENRWAAPLAADANGHDSATFFLWVFIVVFLVLSRAILLRG